MSDHGFRNAANASCNSKPVLICIEMSADANGGGEMCHGWGTSHFRAVIHGVFFHLGSEGTMVQLSVDLEKTASRPGDSQMLPVALSPALA